jgi:membrane protein involved in D-alanine export
MRRSPRATCRNSGRAGTTRWHITLGTYLKDLLFSPLSKYIATKQGGRNIQHAVAIAIFCVFLVNGVWHGVGWNFVLFGVTQGLGVMTVHYYTQYLRRRLGRKSYQEYMANGLVKGAGIAVTQLFYALSLILFANPLPVVGRLLYSVVAWVPYAR